LTGRGIENPPSKELVEWMMAKILLEHNGKLGGRVKNLMKTAYIMASKSLRVSRSNGLDMEKEPQDGFAKEALKGWWAKTRAADVNRF
jgi:hypothetical protein